MRIAVFNRIAILGVFGLFCCMISCTKKTESKVVWNTDLPITGSQSSPRAVDLNEDGVLDLVIGAGRNEYQRSADGILAFDGKTGKVIWRQQTTDQVYGSATFYDVTADGIPEIFIGGRGPHFKALNGKTGEIVWEYQYRFESDSIMKFARFNFNNSVLIPDQNNDGLMDLLTVNGGNAKADPYTTINRYPGVLMIIDALNGNIIAADTMPDGGESYMSPVVFKQKGEEDYSIVFGTGGETLNGNIFIAGLSDLRNKRLSNAKVIASESGHGFIAPPTVTDINGDGIMDIMAISHGSSIFAIDGKTLEKIWDLKIPKTESSNSLAVGRFNDDDTPDFFTFVSKGEWPNSTGSVQIMIDGRDGKILFQDSIGCTGYSSPVVYDINDDGIDEVLISVNEFDCSLGFVGKNPVQIENKLIAINFANRSIQVVDQMAGFKNIFSTPWIGDLDSDGYLDIVECQYYHRGMLLSFLGMRIKRIDTQVPIKKKVVWGAYMGSSGDGVYDNR